MYLVRSIHQSLPSQAPLPPPHLVLELCIGLGPSINVWPVKHHYHHLTNHPTTTIPSYSYVPIIPYLSMDVLCFATKYNSNTIHDHGEILWENVAPYWPVMPFSAIKVKQYSWKFPASNQYYELLIQLTYIYTVHFKETCAVFCLWLFRKHTTIISYADNL